MKDFKDRIINLLKVPDVMFTNFFNKFSEKTKINILYGWMFWEVIYFILFLALILPKHNDGILSEIQTLIFSLFILVNIYVMFYLGGKVTIKQDIIPIIKFHKFNEYNLFKYNLIDSLNKIEFNYENKVEYKNEGEESTIIFNDRINRTYVIQTIMLEEFSDEKIDYYTDLFWNETMKYVGKNAIRIRYIYLMQFICVKSENDSFKEYLHLNIPQEEKRNQIIIGLSLKSKKVYIGQSKGRFYLQYYNKMLSLVNSLTENIFYELETNEKMQSE